MDNSEQKQSHIHENSDKKMGTMTRGFFEVEDITDIDYQIENQSSKK